MAHKKLHTLNLEFTGAQNEIGGVVKSVEAHGTLVQVTLEVDPNEMLQKKVKTGTVACLMSKDTWNALEDKLKDPHDSSGKRKVALAVFTPDNVKLQILPDEHENGTKR